MKLRITVEGKAYDVDVQVLDGSSVPGSAPIAPVATAPTPAAGGTSAAEDVNSPIAGAVTKIHCNVGQTVAAGDTLLVLEAMKMESNIASPSAGTVAEILVKEGDNVNADQLLIRLS